MHTGFVFPGTDPRVALEFALEAEAAGWEAFFVWDSVWGTDPWVTLGAIAARTERIRLGTMLTPVSRRRPWKLAGETATLDQLSGGRAILAVGLGTLETGFAEFGEATERHTRAELLDEGLEVLTRLWAGQAEFEGQHYHIRPPERSIMPPPLPVQQPRIPIWVVGLWGAEKSMQRVARYDGWLPNVRDEQGGLTGRMTPELVRQAAAYFAARRGEADPIDIVIEGETPGDPAAAWEQIRPLAEAGMTWWLESRWSASGLEPVRERVRAGPPGGK